MSIFRSIRIYTHFAAAACVLLALFPLSEGRADLLARYSGEFMAAGGGARALALGGAYTAIADDAWSIFWNPAGTGRIGIKQAALMHSERFAGAVDFDAAAYSEPQSDASVLTLGFLRLGVNGVPFTTLEDPGSPLGENNRVEIDKIVNEAEYAFFAGKSKRVGNWIIGAAPKLIFKHIGSDYRAYGLGIDAGIIGRPFHWIPVTAGLAVRDLLGTLIAWEQTGRKEIIAPSMRLGLGADFDIAPLEAIITPVVDVSYRFESFGGSDAAALHLGFEYLVRKTAALRIGSDDGRITLGGGLNFKPVAIDYAYIGHDELGQTHRVSILIRWGLSIQGD